MQRLLHLFCFLSIFANAALSQVDLGNGLVAYYPFDGNLLDASVNNNNGTPNGTVTYTTDRFGVANSAVRFQGVGTPGRVDVANHPTLQFSTAASFAGWMQVNSAFGTFGNGNTGNGGSQCPWTKNGDAGGGLWHLVTFSNNTINNSVGNVGTPAFTGALNPYALGQWVHFALVMAPTETRMYINGQLVNTSLGAPNFTVMNNRVLSFGRFITNWYPFNGALDDFRVYNRELTQDEINVLSGTEQTQINITIAGNTFCAGSTVNINYNVTSGLIAPGNNYLIQMSDANGNFNNPLSVATISSTATSGNFQITIPEALLTSTGYRIRVLSTNTSGLSNESQPLTINGVLGHIPNSLLYNYIGSQGNRHYFRNPTLLTWSDAQAQAVANGGHLAVVPDAQTNGFLTQNMLADTWIGLTDEVTEGTFVWVDNSPLSYTNWNTGEPNNVGNEDYVVMQGGGVWNDVGVAVTRQSFYQLRPAGIPQSVCTGQAIQLNAAPLQNATYSWSGPNNFSSNQQSPLINNASIANSGIYTLTYSRNGCSGSVITEVTVNQSAANFGQSSPLLPSLSNGLVVHLPMNGNANDISGNNLNGSLQGGVTPTADRFGNPGQALQFNGSNGHIQLPAGVYFDGGSFTVTGWANRANNANWNRLFDFGNGPANNNVLMGLSSATTGRAAIEIYNGTVSAGQFTSPNATSLNTWHHFAFTFENGIGELFVNGQRVAGGGMSSPADIVRTLCYIGRSNWAVDAFFQGAMDDFRIYNRRLTNAEIRNLHMQQPSTVAVTASPEFLCAANPANIILVNSQPGVTYQLRNMTTSTNVGSPQGGNGGNLTFSSGTINQTTQFSFVATTNGTNCQQTLSPNLTIQFGPAAQPTITAGGPTTFCSGQNVELSIPATPGATYQWRRNGNNVGSSAPIFNATEAGTYTVDVINTCGTVSSVNSIVINISGTAPTAPTISASGPTTVCQGQTVTLSVAAQSGVTYQWKRDGVNIGTNNPTFIANQSGLYTIDLISPCGNITSTNNITVTISGQAPIAPTVSVSGNTTFCEGGAATLNIAAQPGVTYQWKRNGVNVGTNSTSFSASQSGVYTVEVTNNCGTVASSNSITITVNPTPATPSISANGPLSFCQGQNVVLSLPSSQAYLWSNGATTQSITVSSSGTFTAQVIQSACTSAVSQAVMVSVNAQPAAPAFSGQAPAICSGNAVNLQVSSPATVNWFSSPSGGTPIGSGSSFNTGILNATATFYAEAAQGACVSATRTAITVTVNPSPVAAIQSVSHVSCHGDANGSIITNIVGASSFSWSNGANSPNLSGLSGGSYTLTAVAANGCSTTVTATVNEPTPILINANVVQISCDNPGRIILTASGGTGSLSFNWAHGPTTPTLNNLPQGTYSVNVTDANGCSRMENYVINPYIELQASVDVTPHSGFMPNGAINLNVSGGIPPYSFDWMSGQTTQNISGLLAGLYFVTVTDSQGCTLDLTIEVPFTVGTQLANQVDINIYPNPASNAVLIDLSAVNSPMVCELFDLSGRLIHKTSTLARELHKLNIDNFANGTYLIRLSSNQMIKTEKIKIIR
ncbi:MAG: LamG-like jellyroll fold domain-containing protein [Flavobacteriales bacterium]